MSYKINLFRARKPISQLGIKIYGYKIFNLGCRQDKFKVLKELCQEISLKLNTLSVRYSPSEEENYILVFNPQESPEEIRANGFILRLEMKGEDLEKYLMSTKRVFYNITRQKLEYHGFWRAAYNKYYSLSCDRIVDGKYGRYKIYRGIFFRYEVINGFIWLVLDPITRIVHNDNLLILLSKHGPEKIKAMFEEGRYITVSQVKGNTITLSVRKVLRLREDLKAGRDEVIEKNGKWYSVKSWYRDYKNLPEIADKIDDNEPLLETEGGIYFAPSMAYLVLRTKDLEGESQDIKSEVYLTVDRRLKQIQRFFNVINPLYISSFPNIPRIEFLEDLAIFKYIELKPPDLRFGHQKSFNLENEGGFQNYTAFFRSKLKKFGPAKGKISFYEKRLVLVYPREYLAEEQVKKFYLDIRRIAKRYLHVILPPKKRLYLWEYSNGDTTEIRKNFSEYKNNVKAVLCILSSTNDPLYFEFKRVFQDVPCQMTTKDLVLKKYNLRDKEMHIYFSSILNLVCGLLGKMGIRPWILDKDLKGDLYIGIDTRPGKVATVSLINKKGNYINEISSPLKGSKIESNIMSDLIIHLIMKSLETLPKDRLIHLVIHRDGDVYQSEKSGIDNAMKLLKQRGLKVLVTLVSIKETTPYRIFKYGKGNLLPCPSGVLVKLDNRMGLLASVGWPMLKQGLAKPLLIEIISNDKTNYTLQDAIKEIYQLSFLHWEGIVKKLKMPITIKYADEYAIFSEREIDIVGPPL